MRYTEVDYIIIGQGIAGSALAFGLMKAGKRIVVIDDSQANISSTIAAGLYNPITGNKMGKTWLAEILFPELKAFYSEVEQVTGRKFFNPMPLFRPFISVEEQNQWTAKSDQELSENLIDKLFTSSAFREVNDSYGGLLVRDSGYINTVSFLEAVRELLLAQGMFHNTRFDPADLSVEQEFATYGGYKAGKVVFCEGTKVVKNPWFNQLPVKALKGETLTIKCAWNKDVILNRGVYMVPSKAPNEFRIGSTYNWNDRLPGVTEAARAEMELKLGTLMRIPFETEMQEWGERPTSPDRRPILGAHPKFKSLVVFNGLGTKGVSLAPYFSRLLIQWMEMGQPLPKEVDVTRFKLLY